MTSFWVPLLEVSASALVDLHVSQLDSCSSRSFYSYSFALLSPIRALQNLDPGATVWQQDRRGFVASYPFAGYQSLPQWEQTSALALQMEQSVGQLGSPSCAAQL